MLQQKKPDDYIIATCRSFSVRQFVEKSFKIIGIDIGWRGNGLNEIGYDKATKNVLVKIDKDYFRPNEVHDLRGDPKKAKKILKWTPKTSIDQMIKEMVLHDIEKVSKISK